MADTGTLTVAGSATSVGTVVTVVLVPTISRGRVIWNCSAGSSAQFKYVPAECRH